MYKPFLFRCLISILGKWEYTKSAIVVLFSHGHDIRYQESQATIIKQPPNIDVSNMFLCLMSLNENIQVFVWSYFLSCPEKRDKAQYLPKTVEFQQHEKLQAHVHLFHGRSKPFLSLLFEWSSQKQPTKIKRR